MFESSQAMGQCTKHLLILWRIFYALFYFVFPSNLFVFSIPFLSLPSFAFLPFRLLSSLSFQSSSPYFSLFLILFVIFSSSSSLPFFLLLYYISSYLLHFFSSSPPVSFLFQFIFSWLLLSSSGCTSVRFLDEWLKNEQTKLSRYLRLNGAHHSSTESHPLYWSFDLILRCWSRIGRDPSNIEQRISIGPGCETMGIAAHELMHTLGFFHEQSRRDRDNFVTVNFENIEQGKYTYREVVEETSSRGKNNSFHKWGCQTSEILLLPREDKIHISELSCNVLCMLAHPRTLGLLHTAMTRMAYQFLYVTRVNISV